MGRPSELLERSRAAVDERRERVHRSPRLRGARRRRSLQELGDRARRQSGRVAIAVLLRGQERDEDAAEARRAAQHAARVRRRRDGGERGVQPASDDVGAAAASTPAVGGRPDDARRSLGVAREAHPGGRRALGIRTARRAVRREAACQALRLRPRRPGEEVRRRGVHVGREPRLERGVRVRVRVRVGCAPRLERGVRVRVRGGVRVRVAVSSEQRRRRGRQRGLGRGDGAAVARVEQDAVQQGVAEAFQDARGGLRAPRDGGRQGTRRARSVPRALVPRVLVVVGALGVLAREGGPEGREAFGRDGAQGVDLVRASEAVADQKRESRGLRVVVDEPPEESRAALAQGGEGDALGRRVVGAQVARGPPGLLGRGRDRRGQPRRAFQQRKGRVARAVPRRRQERVRQRRRVRVLERRRAPELLEDLRRTDRRAIRA